MKKVFTVYFDEKTGRNWIASFKEGVAQKLLFTLTEDVEVVFHDENKLELPHAFHFSEEKRIARIITAVVKNRGKIYFPEDHPEISKGFCKVIYDESSGYWVDGRYKEGRQRTKLEFGRARLLSTKLKAKVKKMEKSGRIYFPD